MSKEKEKERRREADIRRQIKKEYEDKLQENATRIIALESALKQQEAEFRELKRQHHIQQRKVQETEANPLSAIGSIFNSPLMKMAAGTMQYPEPETEAAADVGAQPETNAQGTGTADLKPDFVNDLIFLKKREFLEVYRIEPAEGGYNVFYSLANVKDADLTPVIETIAAKAGNAALLLNKKPISSYDEAQQLMYREAEIPENDVVFH